MSLQRKGRIRVTVAALTAVIAVMLTLVAFSVPLYRLFCAATGFGGATQRTDTAMGTVSDRMVAVRFSTDVVRDLPWRFEPEQREVKVHLGEEKLVFFSAENLSDKSIAGHATFNVTPAKTGVYFNKVQCFCFDEERLGPRQKVEMPVDFFVDAKLADNPETSEVNTITLSHTFFRSHDPEGAKDLSRFTASAIPDPKRGETLFAEYVPAKVSLLITQRAFSCTAGTGLHAPKQTPLRKALKAWPSGPVWCTRRTARPS